MGYDDENLEPKPKSKVKNGIKNESKKYLINCLDDKREVIGNSYEDLIRNIKEKFNLKNDQFRVEYWSNKYQEWLLMESLPENESKLQVKLEKNEFDLKEMIQKEVKNQLEVFSLNENLNFVDQLNNTFKNYIQLDDENTDYLNHFEVAVIFACKRREQKQSIDIEEFLIKNSEQLKLVKQLSDEMKKFQQANKQFKLQLETLSNKIDSFEVNSSSSSSSSSNVSTNKTKKHKLFLRNNNKCIII